MTSKLSVTDTHAIHIFSRYVCVCVWVCVWESDARDTTWIGYLQRRLSGPSTSQQTGECPRQLWRRVKKLRTIFLLFTPGFSILTAHARLPSMTGEGKKASDVIAMLFQRSSLAPMRNKEKRRCHRELRAQTPLPLSLILLSFDVISGTRVSLLPASRLFSSSFTWSYLIAGFENTSLIYFFIVLVQGCRRILYVLGVSVTCGFFAFFFRVALFALAFHVLLSFVTRLLLWRGNLDVVRLFFFQFIWHIGPSLFL